jgi:peptidylprolyl isomerase
MTQQLHWAPTASCSDDTLDASCLMRVLTAALGLWALIGSGTLAAATPDRPPESAQDVLARTSPSDWRRLDPGDTLYLDLAAGRVILELAPAFAPLHVANIKTLVRAHYFDGLSILRVQDDYVVQWGDPDEKRPLGAAAATLPPEFFRTAPTIDRFNLLQDGDVYAQQVGFDDSWPVARDSHTSQEWLTHCYGMLGVGRDTAPESGSGAELYVVIGHAPRHLDRNVTLVGRVVQGIELLSSLPRGTGNLGFYERPEQYTRINSVRVAADLPAGQRVALEVLRSDTPVFNEYLEALRQRRTAWFVEPTGRLELCNAHIPVRAPNPP